MKALYGALPLTIDKTDSLALRAEHGACRLVVLIASVRRV